MEQDKRENDHINNYIEVSLKELFEDHYGRKGWNWETDEAGPVMDAEAKTVSLEREFIYLPLSQEQRENIINNITAPTATKWPGHNRKNHYNSIFHDGSGPDANDSKQGEEPIQHAVEGSKGIFIGTYNQLRQIPQVLIMKLVILLKDVI